MTGLISSFRKFGPPNQLWTIGLLVYYVAVTTKRQCLARSRSTLINFKMKDPNSAK